MISRHLYRILGAAPRQTVATTRYYWDNANRSEHDVMVFQLTYSGCGRYRQAGREWAVPTGKAMLMRIPEDSVYCYDQSEREPWSFGWINLQGPPELWDCLRAEHGPVVPVAPGGGVQSLFEDLARRSLGNELRDTFQASELAYRLLMFLCRELAEGDRADPLTRARRGLQERFSRGLSVKELAREAGYSREHFIRAYRARFGTTPGSELRRLRLQTAAQLLETSSLPIADLAAQSGFGGPSQFCRAFREHQGISPEAYRHGHRRHSRDPAGSDPTPS